MDQTIGYYLSIQAGEWEACRSEEDRLRGQGVSRLDLSVWGQSYVSSESLLSSESWMHSVRIHFENTRTDIPMWLTQHSCLQFISFPLEAKVKCLSQLVFQSMIATNPLLIPSHSPCKWMCSKSSRATGDGNHLWNPTSTWLEGGISQSSFSNTWSEFDECFDTIQYSLSQVVSNSMSQSTLGIWRMLVRSTHRYSGLRSDGSAANVSNDEPNIFTTSIALKSQPNSQPDNRASVLQMTCLGSLAKQRSQLLKTSMQSKGKGSILLASGTLDYLQSMADLRETSESEKTLGGDAIKGCETHASEKNANDMVTRRGNFSVCHQAPMIRQVLAVRAERYGDICGIFQAIFIGLLLSLCILKQSGMEMRKSAELKDKVHGKDMEETDKKQTRPQCRKEKTSARAEKALRKMWESNCDNQNKDDAIKMLAIIVESPHLTSKYFAKSTLVKEVKVALGERKSVAKSIRSAVSHCAVCFSSAPPASCRLRKGRQSVKAASDDIDQIFGTPRSHSRQRSRARAPSHQKFSKKNKKTTKPIAPIVRRSFTGFAATSLIGVLCISIITMAASTQVPMPANAGSVSLCSAQRERGMSNFEMLQALWAALVWHPSPQLTDSEYARTMFGIVVCLVFKCLGTMISHCTGLFLLAFFSRMYSPVANGRSRIARCWKRTAILSVIFLMLLHHSNAQQSGCTATLGTYESAASTMVCASLTTSPPTCEVVFSSLPSRTGLSSFFITVEIANSDFGSSTEYVSAVIVGGQRQGGSYLVDSGEDSQCNKMSKILDLAAVPVDTISSAGELTVRIEASVGVNANECDGSYLYGRVKLTTCTGRISKVRECSCVKTRTSKRESDNH